LKCRTTNHQLEQQQRPDYDMPQSCASTAGNGENRHGFWIGPSIPLTPKWQRIEESQFYRDFLATGHVHDWKFAQGSPYYFFGTTWGGCAIGGGRYANETFWMYASDSTFRAFIRGKLQDGSLTKSNLIALISAPRSFTSDTNVQSDSDALLQAYFAYLKR
jgi:hypothetical protein